MTKEEKQAVAWVFLLVGIVLRLTDALDIVHELMHYGFANMEGIKVTELNWSSIQYARASLSVLYGGYIGEFLLYGTIVLFASIGSFKKIASLFMGILIVAWLAAFVSDDYNAGALEYFGNQRSVNFQLVCHGIWTSLCMLGLIKVYKTEWNK